jgi:secondary thiamine-phosphate synthase enzyme
MTGETGYNRSQHQREHWRAIMKVCLLHCDAIEVSMETGPDVRDITGEIHRILQKSGVEDGIVRAVVIGSTASLTTIEFETGVVEDLKRAIARLAPPDMEYEHEKAWRDGNGHSHVQAALLGPSQTLPVRRGQLRLGAWQQVVVINHDSRPRKRRVDITVLGQRTGPA